MVYIFVIILIFIVMFSIYSERNFYNPITIFSALWALVMILASFQFFDLNITSDSTYALAFFGIVFFILGCMVRTKIKIKSNFIKETSSRVAINYGILVPFYGVILIFTVLLSFISINLLLNGTSFEVIRFNYSNVEEGLVIRSNRAYQFEMYIVAAAEFAAVALFPIVLMDKKSKANVILSLEIIFFLILHMFVTGARSFMINIVFVCVLYYLINLNIRREVLEYYKKIPKSVITIVILGAIWLVIVATNMRKGEGNLLRELYRYFAISFPLLETKLHLDNAYTYGWTIIYGLVRPIFSLIRSFGIDYPDGLQYAIELINANNNFYYVGGGKANSFVTVFYYFYMDFGVIGIPIFSFIYGYFSQSIYKKMIRYPNIKNQALYLLVAVGLFLSFVRFFFTSYRYVYAFFILLLAFKVDNSGFIHLRRKK
ncbi:MAG: oligosaccharide repeat unit polymerase [Clostridiales bacterium]|nr:oligosaccharide repeat unit polymerase [Clostridiales bacterium]